MRSEPHPLPALLAAATLVAGCGIGGIGGERLTVDVHNQSDDPIVLDIVDAGVGDPAEGDVIAAPITLPPGAAGPVTIAAPTTEWALRVRGVGSSFDGREIREWARRAAEGEIDGFRMVIDSTGVIAAEATGP